MAHQKHHYVPVFYLKQFSYEKDRIVHTYDKSINKSIPLSIRDICCESNLYRLSDDLVKSQDNTSLNSLSIEVDYFAKSIEYDYKQVFKWIREETDNRFKSNIHYFGLTDESKVLIAKYITIQYLRTPFIRDKVVAEERRIEEKMLRLFKTGVAIETNNPSIAELNVIPDVDEAACHATQTYLDKDYVDNIINHLAKSYWHFYYSPQSEFYTSDNPVVIIHRGYILNMIQREFGLTDYGAEVSFPITPNLLLSIYDYRYYNQYKGTDGLLKEVDEEYIKNANKNQFTSSKRFVISKTGDFSAIINPRLLKE